MTLHIDGPAVLAFLLALARASAFMVSCPPFATLAIPASAKVAIAAGLALAAVGHLSGEAIPSGTIGLVGACVLQVAIGTVFGLVVQLFVAALSAAGALADQFSGLNLPPALDPLNLEQLPTIGQLYEWVTTVLLCTTGALDLLAGGFLRSFAVVGTSLPKIVLAHLPGLLASDLASLFAASVEIAAPLVAVLLVAQLLLGLLAKAAPQTNVFALGFSLQLLMAFATLGLAIIALPSDLANLLSRGLAQLVGG